MPPKIDPYATRRARLFDLLLILFALLVIAIMICTAPRHRPNTGRLTHPATSHAPVMLASNSGE
jgi:hypothetical protein